MADGPKELLERIQHLTKSADAAAAAELVELEGSLAEGGDKKVRKALRRALHILRSKGIEIPEKGARQWHAAGQDHLRAAVEAEGLIDVRSIPGAARLVFSGPDEVEGGVLMVSVVGGEGRVLDFAAYLQTDGQRTRMLRDWSRNFPDRKVPADWVRARMRHARESTIAAGFTVPQALDDALERLGEAPPERPENFVLPLLADQPPTEKSADDLLLDLGAHRWPLMFDGTKLFDALGKMTADKDKSEEQKRTDLRDAAKGDDSIREALGGAIADLIDDSAAGLWLEGKDAEAKKALDWAAELRGTDEPEGIEWVLDLLRYQIASVALQQMAQQGQL